MTSIINKSKENATINKKVKDGAVTIEVVGSKKQTVRPIMTVEARDILDAMHDTVNCETRSESIVKYFEMNFRVCKQNIKAHKELMQWKLIAWSMTAACISLIATMMITAS